MDYALAAHVRRLALTHHDPLRDDDAVDRLVEVCRERVRRAGGALDVFAAAEGQTIEPTPHETRAPRPRRRAAASTAARSSPAHIVLIADDDPVILELLKATLRSDAFRLYTATDGETALRIARAVRPSLLLLDWLMPGLDGTEVTRALRADPDPYFREVPIVLLTAEAGAEKNAARLRRRCHRLSDQALQGAVRARACARLARACRARFGSRRASSFVDESSEGRRASSGRPILSEIVGPLEEQISVLHVACQRRAFRNDRQWDDTSCRDAGQIIPRECCDSFLATIKLAGTIDSIFVEIRNVTGSRLALSCPRRPIRTSAYRRRRTPCVSRIDVPQASCSPPLSS